MQPSRSLQGADNGAGEHIREGRSRCMPPTIAEGPSQWLLQALRPVPDDYDVVKATADFEIQLDVTRQLAQASKLLQRIRGGQGGHGSDKVLQHYGNVCAELLDELSAQVQSEFFHHQVFDLEIIAQISDM